MANFLGQSSNAKMPKSQENSSNELHNGNMWIFQTEDTKLERFLPQKLLNFENWVNGEVSKFRSHFRNKSRSILKLSKYVNNKKCAPKLIFFNEKKNQNVSISSKGSYFKKP